MRDFRKVVRHFPALFLAIFAAAAIYLYAEDAFVLKGVVLDIKGRPLTFARIIALDKNNEVIRGKYMSNYEGRFNLRSPEVIASIIIVDNDEAVCMRKDGPWSSGKESIIDLSEGAYHTLNGRIIDEDKILLQGIMDEGVKWPGELDLAGRRAVRITAYTNYIELITINPGKDGAFRLKANFPIAYLTLKVPGGGTYLREDGPWNADSETGFTLSPEKIFIIKGYVRDTEGNHQPHENVTANLSQHEEAVSTRTDSKGYFEMRSNRKISSIVTYVNKKEVTKWGPWSTDTELAIER